MNIRKKIKRALIRLFSIAVFIGSVHASSAHPLFSQVKFSAGYGLKPVDPMIFFQYKNTGGFVEFESLSKSFGQGLNLELMVETSARPLSFECGLMFTQAQIRYSQYSEGLDFLSETEFNESGLSLNALTGLVWRSKEGSNTFYSRAGIIIGLHSERTHGYDSKLNGTDNTSEYYKDEGGYSFGIYTAIGYEVQIAPRIRLFPEIKATGISYRPARSKLVIYKRYGEDNLNEQSMNKRRREYHKNYTGVNSPEHPSRIDQIEIPFGAVNLGLGVVFILYREKD